MAYEFISRSDLSARVAAVCATAVKAQAEIHACAVSGLEHTRVHGDYTSMEALLNGLPRGTRVKALAYWFKHFSNGKLTFKIDEAIATTFADLTNEKSVESVTVESLLKALRNKATNTDYFEGTTIPKVTQEARIAASKLIAFAIEQGMDVKAA